MHDTLNTNTNGTSRSNKPTYFVMHPQDLDDHELDYELELRKDTESPRDSRRKKKFLLLVERIKLNPKTDWPITFDSTEQLTNELNVCESNIEELAQESIDCVDYDLAEEVWYAIASRIVHYERRLNRIDITTNIVTTELATRLTKLKKRLKRPTVDIKGLFNGTYCANRRRQQYESMYANMPSSPINQTGNGQIIPPSVNNSSVMPRLLTLEEEEEIALDIACERGRAEALDLHDLVTIHLNSSIISDQLMDLWRTVTKKTNVLRSLWGMCKKGGSRNRIEFAWSCMQEDSHRISKRIKGNFTPSYTHSTPMQTVPLVRDKNAVQSQHSLTTKQVVTHDTLNSHSQLSGNHPRIEVRRTESGSQQGSPNKGVRESHLIGSVLSDAELMSDDSLGGNVDSPFDPRTKFKNSNESQEIENTRSRSELPLNTEQCYYGNSFGGFTCSTAYGNSKDCQWQQHQSVGLDPTKNGMAALSHTSQWIPRLQMV